MNIESVIYLTDILHNIDFISGMFFIIGLILTMLCLAFGGFARIDSSKEWEESFLYKFSTFLKIHIYKIIIFIVISCLIPSQKTMYLMIGANYLKSSELPSKVEIAINKKIDEYLLEENKK